jgi:hypothetical protein
LRLGDLTNIIFIIIGIAGVVILLYDKVIARNREKKESTISVYTSFCLDFITACDIVSKLMPIPLSS